MAVRLVVSKSWCLVLTWPFRPLGQEGHGKGLLRPLPPVATEAVAQALIHATGLKTHAWAGCGKNG